MKTATIVVTGLTRDGNGNAVDTVLEGATVIESSDDINNMFANYSREAMRKTPETKLAK